MGATDVKIDMFWDILIEDLEGNRNVRSIDNLRDALVVFEELKGYEKRVRSLQMIEHKVTSREVNNWVRD